ncbi:(2Fe-2S)-binding protein [Candidatus Neomarinimicrobiota bacterium]
MLSVTFTLNGQAVTAETHPGQTLLEYLRSIGIFSVKFGCGTGECGTCTVLVDNQAMNACLLLMPALENRQVETLEALEADATLSGLQERFIDEGAIQCGYCTPGMLLSLTALLREDPTPDGEAVRDALNGNLCRCTGYVKPVGAAEKFVLSK